MFFKTRMAEVMMATSSREKKMKNSFGMIVTEEGVVAAEYTMIVTADEVRHLGNEIYGYQKDGNWIIRIPAEVTDKINYLTSACWLLNLQQEEVARTIVNGKTMFDLRTL